MYGSVHQYDQPVACYNPHSSRQITDTFASQLEVAMESPTIGYTLYSPSVERLAAAIYAPYYPYISLFGQYEEATLLSALEKIRLVRVPTVLCFFNRSFYSLIMPISSLL